MSGGDRKGTFKVEFLKEVERVAQEKWERMKAGLHKVPFSSPLRGEGNFFFF